MDEYPVENGGGVFVNDEYPSRNMGQILVHWMNTLSRNMGQAFVLWTNALPEAWGKHSSVDESYVFDGYILRVLIKSIRIRARRETLF